MKESKVSIVKLGEDPTGERIEEGVRKAVGLVGRMGDIVMPGERVLIKPNWCVVPLEPKVGVVTNVAVVRAVARMVREVGGKPVISDSAARGVNTDLVIAATGYDKLREEGIEVVNLEKTKVVYVPIPGAKVLSKMKTFELVTKVDRIIDVPLMKTHDGSVVTLGLKNMKGLLHKDYKSRLHREGLYEGVVDIFLRFKPDLVVVDGTWAMEGLGPLFGIPVALNIIMAGRDAVAVDSIAGQIMGFEPAEVPITRLAAERGLGYMDNAHIEVVGEALDGVKRRFVRLEEDDRLIFGEVNIVHAEGTCTGCKTAILSSLFDMKNEDILGKAAGFTIATGDVGLLPDVPEDRLVAVGICVPKGKRSKRWAKGCPPNNVYIVEAITGESRKDTYATD